MTPMRPLKPCRYPGCPELTAGRMCPEHATVEHTHIRGRAQTNPHLLVINRWYDSSEWRVLRREKLRRNPLCQACSTDLNPVVSTEVDHVLPIRLGGNKRDYNNMQTLCKPCHDRKRQKESLAER